MPPGLAGASVLTLDWGWRSSHCLDHSSRGPGGFFTHWKLNVMPPAIHWPELTTRPCPARKCYPSLCPESRKPGIVGENITPTVCPSNHQKCGSLSFLQAKYTHPPLQGRWPKQPMGQGVKLKVQDLWVIRAHPYSTSGCKPEAQTHPKCSTQHTPMPQNTQMTLPAPWASSARALILRDMLPNLIFSMVFRSILGDRSFSTVLLGETQRSNSLSLFPL